MTNVEPSAVMGTVDRDGRLLSADAGLLALQVNAGGDPEGVLAVPQLASLSRLARTLGVVVSRSVIAADGELDLDLWVRASPEGDVVRLAIAGWTERTPVEISPQHHTERAQMVASMGEDGHWTADSRLRLISLDAGLANLLTREWRGARLTRIFALERAQNGDFPLFDALLDDLNFTDQLAFLIDDPDIELILHGGPEFDDRGLIKGYRGGFRWVSAPPAQAEVVEAVGEEDPLFLDRLDQALRRPIGRIIQEADAISAQREGALQENYAGYAGDIASAGRHLLGLVDDLADLQAVDRSDVALDIEKLDLADVARRAASLLGVRAADSRVQIDAPDHDEQLWVMGDFRRALQILVNLVGNAVRYAPEGSMVWIRTEEVGDLAAIIVADQGKGISPDDQDRIFEKFERVDTTEPGGSGLGLYISRRLARAMGGDITVDSAPGLGARFILTLPAATS